MIRRLAQAAPLLGAVILCAGAAGDDSEFTDSEVRRILSHAPLGPPPPDPTNRLGDSEELARIGQSLFFEPRLSANGEISCATCHDPARGFADGKVIAEGLGQGTRHTLSLMNVAYNRWFFWDGRADTLWSQALRPLERPEEMGGSRLRVAHLLRDDAALRAGYEGLFGPLPDLAHLPPDGCPVPDDPDDARHRAWATVAAADRDAVNHVFANAGKAIAAYERRLVSRRSAFDVFAEGLRDGEPAKRAALGPEARRGLKLFIGRADCRRCHTGPTFTDGEFHDVGVPPRGGGMPTDPGRYRGAELVQADPFNAAGAFSDAADGAAAHRVRRLANGPDNWGRFKTPTLRNVALTAPYMHQGQYETLEDVLEHYSTLADAVRLDHHQEQVLVPLNLTEREIADLAAFLRSLTGERLDPSLLSAPRRADAE